KPVDAAPDHGGGVSAPVPHASSRCHAQRDLAAARAHHADVAGGSRWTIAMSLCPYAFFILGAYCVAALIIAPMVAWVAIDYRRQSRAIADLEARGTTRRSGRPGEVTP